MHIVKKLSGVILAYVILCVLLSIPECAAENKTLLFVGNDSYPPISYQEGEKAKGLAIDIVRALGERMGWQIDIRLMEWKVAQAMVAQGKADALCQLSVTEARKQIYDFSDQAHDLRFSIFVRTGKQGINDLSDLRGLQVAVIAASVQHQFVMADPQIKFTLTANDLQGFQLLKDGKVDVVLADLWTGSYVLAEKRITGIQTSGEPFAHLASAIAVKKGNSALLSAINNGLRSFQADGTIERINEKWRPQEIIVQTREQAMRKTYYILIGILGLLLVIGAFWLVTLKREISERRRAEAAIQLNNAILETVAEGIFLIGVDDNIIKWTNRKFEEMFGYGCGDMVGMHVDRVNAPTKKTPAETRISIVELLLKDGEWNGEIENIRKDGTHFWCHIHVSLFDHPEYGKVMVSAHTDITERKQAETALQQTSERLDLAQRAAKVGTWDWDVVRGHIEWSTIMFDIFGLNPLRYTASLELWKSILHPEDIEIAEYRIEQALRQKTILNSDYRIVMHDGQIRWINAVGEGKYDDQGRPIRMIGICMDITERKRSEAELVRLATAIEQAHETIMILNPDGIIQYVNKAVEQLIGKTRQELTGNNIPIDKRYADQFRNAFEIVNAGKPWTETITETKADGTGCDLDLTITPVHDDKGTIISIVSIGRDVTRERQLEEQLRQSQKMEAIGTLAGGIAHDFNNILGGLLNFAEILKDEMPQDNQSVYHLDQILKLVDRAANLVQQILTFSRKTHGIRKPMELSPLIQEVLNMLRASLPTTIEIRQKLSDKESLVEANSTQIHQVLMNLCTNAGHAMQENGGVLEIELARVSLSSEDIARYKDIDPGSYVQLRVSDTGTGIDPLNINRIFDPFFTTKEVGKGTGLGLSVVHGIIKEHKGHITVSSKPGKGTTFTILLPEVSAPVEINQKENNTELFSGNEHILFVDDEKYITDTVKLQLEPFGYRVTAVQSSQEALEIFQKSPEKFDLVITDLTMPHMTGYDLVQQLIKFRPGIPVILCTGYNDTVLENKEKEQSIKAVLIKPVNRRVLAEMVRKVLDTR